MRGRLLLLALAIGVALRLAAATAGHNWDMQTWEVVGNLVNQGGNIYADTGRYNYGPVWAYVLGGLKKIEFGVGLRTIRAYHVIIAAFLTWVDLLLAWSLARWFDRRSGLLVFLNPIAILLTGYHSQFEALAVLFALWSWVVLRGRATAARPGWGALLGAAALMGLSLATKHVFIFFPLWVLWDRGAGSWTKRLAYCAVAYATFLLAFAPYLADPAAKAGIVANVVHYGSFSEEAFFPRLLALFVPPARLDGMLGWVPIFPGSRALWPCLTVALGWYVARRSADDLFFVYLVALLVLAPALSIQQLAIPVAACAYFWRRWELALFTLSATCLLLGSSHNVASSAAVGPWVRWASALDLRLYHAIAWLALFLVLYCFGRRIAVGEDAVVAPIARAA